ncbi:MAG: histidine phosphatase family protein [Gammaproteobacteria bacterium]|nr:histidine phosphatase family protein [Gammaproteobacteria bacterium]MBT8111028.1 histidine phosphatase family protein [Gammaproteobacteria bacterium]NND48464.1 histidine phosphatase family protein [Woeseiaceae bacterium]NNL45726.1 histidine phosphatase family protein [Woeseiaceae bacterium]
MANPTSRTKADIDRRRRRRRRRVQIIVIYTAIAVCLAWFFESQATTTVIFVRHAERATQPVEDPGLSEAGRQRAAELARQLVDADVVPGVGVDAIYSTSYRRSIETANPVADALNLPVLMYDVSDTEAITEAIVKEYKGKIILVVGHSNTVPEMIANMGASKNVPEISQDEYDNIYLVTIPWFGKTKTIRLRYGEPYVP